MDTKQDAYEFLAGLQKDLDGQLPGPMEIRAAISARWDKPPKERNTEDQLACRENVFLYHSVLPILSSYMGAFSGMDADKIRQSIRCEYYKKFPHISSANTRRIQGHPFDKNLRRDSNEIIKRWRSQKGSFGLNEAYPDLSISTPFPFKIVFDAKFFTGKSPSVADQALVTGVHEVVFYRGLPSASSEYAARSGWSYDFGCLLAYDASAGAFLQKAWDSVLSKRLFWDDAHVFVMILRGAK